MTEVTYEEVEHYLGGQGNLSIEEMIGLITDFANDDIDPEVLKENIIEFNLDNPKE